MVDFSDPGKRSIPYEIRPSLEHLRKLIDQWRGSQSKRHYHVRNWVKSRDFKEKHALHSWAVTILEDRLPKWDSLHDIFHGEAKEHACITCFELCIHRISQLLSQPV